jgi:hypothetical protein
MSKKTSDAGEGTDPRECPASTGRQVASQEPVKQSQPVKAADSSDSKGDRREERRSHTLTDRGSEESVSIYDVGARVRHKNSRQTGTVKRVLVEVDVDRVRQHFYDATNLELETGAAEPPRRYSYAHRDLRCEDLLNEFLETTEECFDSDTLRPIIRAAYDAGAQRIAGTCKRATPCEAGYHRPEKSALGWCDDCGLDLAPLLRYEADAGIIAESEVEAGASSEFARSSPAATTPLAHTGEQCQVEPLTTPPLRPEPPTCACRRIQVGSRLNSYVTTDNSACRVHGFLAALEPGPLGPFLAAFYCEHANETPTFACRCGPKCACREFMCIPGGRQ